MKTKLLVLLPIHTPICYDEYKVPFMVLCSIPNKNSLHFIDRLAILLTVFYLLL